MNNPTLLRRRYQSQQTRAQLRSRRGFVRTNERKVIKAKAGWSKWLERFGWSKMINGKPTVIPVDLRPWVPAVRDVLVKGGARADLVVSRLDEICTPAQFKHLLAHYPILRVAYRDFAGYTPGVRV